MCIVALRQSCLPLSFQHIGTGPLKQQGQGCCVERRHVRHTIWRASRGHDSKRPYTTSGCLGHKALIHPEEVHSVVGAHLGQLQDVTGCDRGYLQTEPIQICSTV